MRYYALASDFDGTLADHGRVDASTLEALQALKNSGRLLILVTGRDLEDLLSVFPQVDLCERVVAENGALLYRPNTREIKVLGEAPPDEFIRALRRRGVAPLSAGRVIVATWQPHETRVLEVIRDLGMEHQVIFNKGAVMVLPSGVNKATGLRAALDELGFSPHNVVGIGDAENDHAFLNLCECSTAVANALPLIKEKVDLVTRADHGAGVAELITRLLATDLAEIEDRLERHRIPLGRREEGQEVFLKPYGTSVLLTGTSGSGKSTLATGLLEHLAEKEYQFCIVDPEGDYQSLEQAIVLGDSKRPPTVNEALRFLEKSNQNAVINLLGLPLEHRPAFFETLLSALLDLRLRKGRPHWMVIDEAHHLLPPAWASARASVPPDLRGLLMITVHPDHVARAVLAAVDLIIATGESPEETLRQFSEALDLEPPRAPVPRLRPGEAIAWWYRAEGHPFRFRSSPPRADRLRHRHKYAEGELGPERSFYFRGPEGKLNLRAQNLHLFLQLAEGVDDETWEYHLRRGDYSGWLREAIKDEDLAREAAELEKRLDLTPAESRSSIRALIEERYTAPA